MSRFAVYSLRWHLTAFLCCMAVSGLLLQQTWRHYMTYRQLHADANAQAGKTARSIEQFQASENTLRQEIARFLEFKTRDIVSTQASAPSTAVFPSLQRDLRIARLDHEFSAPAVTESPVGEGGYQIHTRQLWLHISLLHEAELLSILHQLSLRAPALLRLQECQLALAPGADLPHRSPLLAHCRLEWITFNKEG